MGSAADSGSGYSGSGEPLELIVTLMPLWRLRTAILMWFGVRVRSTVCELLEDQGVRLFR